MAARWQLNNEVTITLDVTTKDDRATIAVEGDNAAEVRQILETANTVYGHALDSMPTAGELDATLKDRQFRQYSPEMLEGVGLIPDVFPAPSQDKMF